MEINKNLAFKIMILYYAHFLGIGVSMRFYVEGYELDVSDPTFFIDVEKYQECKESLDEMLETYVNVSNN